MSKGSPTLSKVEQLDKEVTALDILRLQYREEMVTADFLGLGVDTSSHKISQCITSTPLLAPAFSYVIKQQINPFYPSAVKS